MIREMIRKKGRKLAIVSGIILVGLIGFFVFFAKEYRLLDAVKPRCEIKEVGDVNRCYEKNRYVTVHFKDAYTTNYAYFKGEKEVAEYVDLDLDQYSFLSLIDISLAESIFDKKVTSVNGKLIFFADDDVHKDILKKIKKDYIDEFTKEEGVTEEMVLATFHPVQLDQYQGDKTDDFIWLGVFGGAFLVVFFFFGRGIWMMLKPEKTKALKEHEEEIEKIEYEIVHAKKQEFKKRVITEHYVVDHSSFHFKAYRIDEIAWIYLYIQKRNGIEVSRYYIVKLRNGKQFTLPNQEELITAIQEQNARILIGYTDENQKAYKELRKQG